MNYIEADADDSSRGSAIRLHSGADFEGMRKAGRLAAECLDMLVPMAVPGVTTEAIDEAAREIYYGQWRPARLSWLPGL